MSKARRVTSNSIKKFQSISSHSTNKDRSFSKKYDKKNENSFVQLFKKFCDEECIHMPKIKVAQAEPPPKNFDTISDMNTGGNNDPKQIETKGSRASVHSKCSMEKVEDYRLFALYDNPDYPNMLNTILLKNYVFQHPFMNIFREVFSVYPTITTLRLEFCCLTAEDIQTLSDVLQDFENVNDLSVDGNPNILQNFHVLLKIPSLVSLSMKHCSIMDRTSTAIATILSNYEGQTLMILNLTSNNISDTGVEALAQMLRTNRQLVYLGLADNYITDVGCITLANVLKKFPLTHEEIIIRRQRNMYRLRKRCDMLEEFKRKLKSKASDTNSDHSLSITKKRSNLTISKKKGKKSSNGEASTRSKTSPRSSFEKTLNNNSKKRRSADSVLQKIKKTDSIELPQDTHPFLAESYPKDKQIFCKGNFILSQINLAYNKITKIGAKAILEVLEYQKDNPDIRNDKGIQRVRLDGNMLLEDSSEFMGIQLILQEKLNRQGSDVRSMLSEKRKRKSSAKSISSR